MQRRRAAARSRRLCITCLKDAPPPKRSVCARCNGAAKLRVAQMRERRKNIKTSGEPVYEAAGDAAMQRFAYNEAFAQYALALKKRNNAHDEVRLFRKVVRAIANGLQPELATRWIELAIRRCGSIPSLQDTKSNLIALNFRQCWLEARGSDCIIQAKRALRCAEKSGDPISIRIAKIRLVELGDWLGYSNEAVSFLFSDEVVDS